MTQQAYPQEGRGAIVLPLPSLRPTPEQALSLYYRFFLNRLDRLAVKLLGFPDWVIPRDPENIDELLTAHCTPGECWSRYTTTKDRRGRHPARWRVGAPCLSKENTCKWACLDFDGAGKVQGKEHKAPLVNPLGAALAAFRFALSLGLAAHLEKSGSATGWHLWIFFEVPIPAIDARRLGRWIVANISAELRALVDGKISTGLDAQGIEVFPKQIALSGPNKVGNMLWLPWWGNAEPGGSLIYQVTTEGALGEIDNTYDLTANTPSAVSCALKQAPEDKEPERRSPAVRSTPRTTKSEDFVGAGGGWPEWRQEVLQRINIETLYSRYLTGKDHGNGSLECRDFRAPDKHPSALVATGAGQMERGSFFSYRDGVTLTAFDFLVASNEVSDLDAAFAWVAEHTGIKTPDSTPRRYTEQLAAAKQRAQAAPLALPIDEAGELLRAEFENAFLAGGFWAFVVSLAGGKTTQVCTVIKNLVSKLEPKQTIAYHVENHDQAREVYAILKGLGVSARREFSPGGKDGLLIEVIEVINNAQVKRWKRVCKVDQDIYDAELAAGLFSKDVCAGCKFKDECPARPGFEGDKDAPVIVATHATPKKEATFFIVDEQHKSTEENTIEISDLDALTTIKTSETIRDSQWKFLSKEGRLIKDKLKNGQDIFIETSEDIILNLEKLNDKKKIAKNRAIIRRKGGLPPIGDKSRPCEGPALKAAKWIIDAALSGSSIYKTTIKGVKKIGFSQITRMGQALHERKNAIFLDATASKESILALEMVVGKKVDTVTIAVKDGVQVDRVWSATTATGKDNVIDKHGRADWEKIKAEVNRIKTELDIYPYVKTPLLIWYKTIVDPLREALASSVGLDRGEARTLPESPISNVQPANIATSTPKLNKAQNAALEAFKPLLDLVATRGGDLKLMHWGKVKGINAHETVDAVLSLGALFPPLEDIRRLRSKVGLSIGSSEKFTAEEYAHQLSCAAAELDQGLGRARVTRSNGRERVLLLAMGPALPPSFRHGEFEFRHHHRTDGRPRREAPQGEDIEAELLQAKEKAGGVRPLARSLVNPTTGESLSPSSLQEYLKGTIPPAWVRQVVKEFLGVRISLREEREQAECQNQSETNEKAEGEFLALDLSVHPSPRHPALPYQVSAEEAEEKGREARATILEAWGESPWTALTAVLRVPRVESLGDSVAGLNLTPADLEPSLNLESAEELAAYLEIYKGATREEAQRLTLAAYDRLVRNAPIWALCDLASASSILSS